jgi:hypothetical protein
MSMHWKTHINISPGCIATGQAMNIYYGNGFHLVNCRLLRALIIARLPETVVCYLVMCYAAARIGEDGEL